MCLDWGRTAATYTGLQGHQQRLRSAAAEDLTDNHIRFIAMCDSLSNTLN